MDRYNTLGLGANVPIAEANGAPVEIIYSRDGRRDKVTLQATKTEHNGQEVWMIGVALEPRVVFVKLPFVQALNESVHQNLKSATVIFKFLKGIIERRMSPKSLEGPIRIAQLSGDAAREHPDRE